MQTDPTKTIAQLNRLLSAFPAATNAEPDEILARYIEAIIHLPYGDLETAVGQYIRGEVPGQNPRFAPTAPELAGAIRRIMEKRLDAVNARKQAVLQITAREADVEKTDASRERVKAMVANLLQRMADNMLTEDAKTERTRKSLQERTNAAFDPPKDDREMLKRLGYSVGNDGERYAS